MNRLSVNVRHVRKRKRDEKRNLIMIVLQPLPCSLRSTQVHTSAPKHALCPLEGSVTSYTAYTLLTTSRGSCQHSPKRRHRKRGGEGEPGGPDLLFCTAVLYSLLERFTKKERCDEESSSDLFVFGEKRKEPWHCGES